MTLAHSNSRAYDYRERVEKLIKSKTKGHQVEVPAAEEEEPETLNLMDALQKSVARSHGAKKPDSRKKSSSRSA